jgi:hypothetical protein
VYGSIYAEPWHWVKLSGKIHAPTALLSLIEWTPPPTSHYIRIEIIWSSSMRGAEVKQLLSLNGIKQQSSSQLRYQSTDRIILSPWHMCIAFRMLVRSSNVTNSTKYRCNLRGARGGGANAPTIYFVRKNSFLCCWVEAGQTKNMEVFSTRLFSGVKTHTHKKKMENLRPN